MKKLFLILIILLPCLSFAQEESTESMDQLLLARKWHYDLKAGVNIGGTSPLPIPQEIREIKTFDPSLQLSIAIGASYWFNDKIALSSGVKLENKGMETKARVKNYYMEIVTDDGGRTKGNFTGIDFTSVDQKFITIPLVVKYQPFKRWEFNGGMFFSYLRKGNFSGYVEDGYLREGNPTGTKVKFENGARATYSFGDEFNKFEYGAQLGFNAFVFQKINVLKNVSIFGDLTWGLRDVFKKDFQTIAFGMYPIYFNFGLGFTL